MRWRCTSPCSIRCRKTSASSGGCSRSKSCSGPSIGRLGSPCSSPSCIAVGWMPLAAASRSRRTGLLFVLYRPSIPFARIIFALTEIESYIGRQVEIEGWFRRRLTPYIEIAKVTTDDGSSLRAYARWIQYGLAALAAVGGFLWLPCLPPPAPPPPPPPPGGSPPRGGPRGRAPGGAHPPRRRFSWRRRMN